MMKCYYNNNSYFSNIDHCKIIFCDDGMLFKFVL